MANGRKSGSLVQELRRHYLCNLCAQRNGGLPNVSGRCEICRGIMTEIGSIADKILTAISRYEFSTFLIGAVLPTQLYEREDSLRARLKIRGMESVKSQLTRELGLRVSRMTGRAVDYLRPDLTISIVIDKDNSFQISTRSRPLLFQGRYVKKSRGIPQKQERCTTCDGKGCDQCNNSGLSGYESVEGVVTKRLVAATKGKTPRFSWVGSEDRESLVLGLGRPFVVQVFDPKKRTFGRNIIAAGRGVRSTLAAAAHAEVEVPRFSVRTRILARCERPVSHEDLKKLESLSGVAVSFESKSKIATKRIYSAAAGKKDEFEFYLDVEADGGLGIKQLVGGEQHVSTSVSQLLGAKCDCIFFDILSVTFLSDRGTVTPA